MLGSVEARVRRVVVDQLGVNGEDLAPEVSLGDDLAADSLDLLEVAVALESELGIELSDAALQTLRTYGDLVRLTVALVAEQACDTRATERPPAVQARVVLPSGQPVLERSVVLTPYMAETIAEDARWAGRGARVEIAVPPETSEGAVSRFEETFAAARALGIEVHLSRAGFPLAPDGVAPAPPGRRGPTSIRELRKRRSTRRRS